MNEKIFPEGFFYKTPSDKAPEFVKGKIGIHCKVFVEWMRLHHTEGWVNMDLLISKAGKPYAALNDYKPEDAPPSPQPQPQDNPQQPQSGYTQPATPTQANTGFEEDVPF